MNTAACALLQHRSTLILILQEIRDFIAKINPRTLKEGVDRCVSMHHFTVICPFSSFSRFSLYAVKPLGINIYYNIYIINIYILYIYI